MCVCVCQTALFKVAGTGALTAWQAPAGYWPTDGEEGGVCWWGRVDCGMRVGGEGVCGGLEKEDVATVG